MRGHGASGIPAAAEPMPVRMAFSGGTALSFGVLAIVLLAIGPHDYPDLHTILDTSMCLLSAMLALLLVDIGRRLDRPFALWLAASFGVTSLLEFVHVMVTVEWWGSLAPLIDLQSVLRPSTWPPAAHVLPIGIGLAIWHLRHGGSRGAPWFLPAIVLIGAALFEAFHVLPTYTPPTWFGITRPGLILVPLLWAGVGVAAWRWRESARELPALADAAVILTIGHLVMLYSRAPHDAPAMVAHFGKIGGYVVFLLALMRLASRDMLERLRAERAVTELNAALEQRVWDRTAEIAAVNKSLESEVVERRKAAQALGESERRFQTLTETLPQLVWTCNPDGWCDYLSKQWLDFTGRPGTEQLGFGWLDQIHPDDRERVTRAWSQAASLSDMFDIEFRIRRHDGAHRWFKTRAMPLRDGAGTIVKWFGSNTDIEDMKLAEQRAEARSERLNLLHQITRAIGERQDLGSIFQVAIRSVEDQLPADFCCLCLHDPSDAVLTVTGVGAKSEALAQSLAMPERARIDVGGNGLARCLQGMLVYEADLTKLDFPFPSRLAQGGLGAAVFAPLQVESDVFGVLIAARRMAGSFSSGENEFLRQLSEHVALAAHQAQLHEALQQAYEDLRQTQQTVMQQERLRALGQMASGIAHDINNALTPASLYAESLLEDETLNANARKTVEVIDRAIGDVAHTVARMREFYRQHETQLELMPVGLNELVRQVVGMTQARWRDMPMQRGIVIDIALDLADDLPPVMGIESEIREALINLVTNAVDAMPDGGRINLRTDTLPGANGDRVRIEVIDQGSGMDEKTRQRCLEPFFTTKGERGTGLGLAMVYGVARRHDAEIEIDSAPGMGTTVRISFIAADLERSDDEREVEPAKPRPRLHLLLVDDDPLLLKSLRDILETDGHSVVAANGGQAGIDAFSAASGAGKTFAAVITDLGMPHIDGRRVAAAIKARSPTTPVILLTGWGQRLIAEDDIPTHVDRVLSKPPRLRDLREALAALQRGA